MITRMMIYYNTEDHRSAYPPRTIYYYYIRCTRRRRDEGFTTHEQDIVFGDARSYREQGKSPRATEVTELEKVTDHDKSSS